MAEREGQPISWNERLRRLVGKEDRCVIEAPYAKVVIKRKPNQDNVDWTIKIIESNSSWSEVEFVLREGEGLVDLRAKPSISDSMPGLGGGIRQILDRSKVPAVTFDALNTNLDQLRGRLTRIINYIEFAQQAQRLNAAHKVA